MKTNIQHPTRNIEHRIKLTFCFSLLLLIAALCGGCTATGGGSPFSIKGALTQPFIKETNVVEQVTLIPATTNVVAVGTNLVSVITPESFQTNHLSVTSWRVNPDTQASLDFAKGLNSATNPTPAAPFINWGIGLLSAGLTAFAGWKTRQANRKATEKTDLLHTVIAGVEAINIPAVKEKISEFATLVKKNNDALDKEVQLVTRGN